MYEEIKIQNEIEKKLGKRDWNQEEFRDLGDINYTMKNGGFALYFSEEVFFLRINTYLRTVMPLVRMKFKLNKAQMTVNSVCACPDTKLIVISLQKDYDYLLIVLNIEENREIYNFSTSKYWSFTNGPQSKARFILNGDTYVNHEKELFYYFFEYNFQNSTFNDKMDIELI